MALEITTEIEIDRPRQVVADFAADPGRAPDWYVNIKHAEWVSEPVVAVGSRIALTAHFLGRKFDYVYVISEYTPGERLVMKSDEGMVKIQTTYEWADTPSGGTRMTLHNTGDAAFIPGLATPVIVRAMRHANRKDLNNLKKLLER